MQLRFHLSLFCVPLGFKYARVFLEGLSTSVWTLWLVTKVHLTQLKHWNEFIISCNYNRDNTGFKQSLNPWLQSVTKGSVILISNSKNDCQRLSMVLACAFMQVFHQKRGSLYLSIQAKVLTFTLMVPGKGTWLRWCQGELILGHLCVL